MTADPTLKPLSIETLGGLRVILGGAPAPGFISRKVDALLVFLACMRREHPREMLGELLWDDLSQERTMGNLRTALSDHYSLQRGYRAGRAGIQPARCWRA